MHPTNSDIPTVSVCMVTFNQDKYIGIALDSILSQKCNFKYDVMIGDDLSSDNTRKILQQYADAHPGIIKPIFHPKNLGYQGQVNFTRVLEACTGKYIAFLEGDDFWSDPLKLQKQFDFMENNPGYSMCFSAVDIVDSEGVLQENTIYKEITKDPLTIEDVITAYTSIMPAATLFFRNQLPHPLPDFFTKAQNGDIALHLIVAHQGNLKYLPYKTACYRVHSASITKTQEHIDNYHTALVQLHKDMNKHFNYKYAQWFRKRIFQLSRIMLIDDARDKRGMKRVKHYFDRMPDYLKYSEKINYKELFYYHMVLLFPSILKKLKSPTGNNKL